MANKNTDERSDVQDEVDFQEATESALVQAAAAGGPAVLSGPPWLAAVTGGAAFLAAMYPSVRKWWEKRSKRFASGYAPNEAEEEAARLLLEASGNPETADVVVEMYRRVQDALDDAVVPALGRLMREYTDAKRPVDSYLRGMSRLLAELDRIELTELRRLFAYLVGVVQRVGTDVDFLTVIEMQRGDARLAVKGYDERGSLTEVPSGPRLLTLLAANGIGREAVLWGDGAGLEIPIPLVVRVDHLINATDN